MVKSKSDIIAPNKRRGVLTISKPKSRPPSSTNGTSGNIKVVVRVRPFNERERQAGESNREIIKIIDEQLLVFDPKENDQPFFYHGVQQKNRDLLKKSNKDMQFVFDRVFHPTLSNEEVFKNSTYSLINSLMDGFNCSVFAYGATGAGKTFTMIGTSEMPGITYLTMAELFKRKEELSDQRDFELGISYLEVYNENVQDLLNPGSSLHLREDSKYGVMVAGIKIHRIENPDELFSLLEAGNKNRTQHPTDANAESSRSHAVFQVYLHMTMKITQEVRTAKLSMIDLAGSERASATGCVGARFAEGANINKSLLALGNCINSLADGHRHIPYRDSKLTRLLKDSLGGNCQTIMIANVSPASLTYEDTYNTLKYATRAKKIKSNIKRNVVNVEMHVGQYVKIVEELKEENKTLKKKIADLEKEKEQSIKNSSLESSLHDDLLVLLKEKKMIIERQYQIESLDLGMAIRKHFKEEADTRVSGHCIDTPERDEAHKKIGNIVERFQNKGTALKDELVTLQKKRIDLECKINELVTTNLELQPILEIENKKLTEIEMKNRSELTKKKLEIMEDELQSQHALLEKMSNLIKPLYLTVKGHGFATDSLTKQYQALSKQLEGVKSIKWSDSCSDSGLSSTTSLSTEVEFSNPESDTCSTISLNDTFTLKNTPRIKHSQEKLINKVHKAPLMKKYGIKVDPLKENKSCRRPLPGGIMGTKRVVSAKIDVKKITNKALVSRPIFKR